MRINPKNISGLKRLREHRNYKPILAAIYEAEQPKKQSEDTIIRKDIYCTIINMMKQDKSDIEIEVFLTSKYPNYAEIIPKFISDQFAKRASHKKQKLKTEKTGDER